MGETEWSEDLPSWSVVSSVPWGTLCVVTHSGFKINPF